MAAQSTWCELGNQKMYAGDYEGAISDYNKEIELDPENAPVMYLLGLAHFGAGRKEEAKKFFARAMELGYYVPKLAVEMCEK
jgi:tetratricopeptide (TPR) repeat protein